MDVAVWHVSTVNIQLERAFFHMLKWGSQSFLVVGTRRWLTSHLARMVFHLRQLIIHKALAFCQRSLWESLLL
jgi:hypothetical protein